MTITWHIKSLEQLWSFLFPLVIVFAVPAYLRTIRRLTSHLPGFLKVPIEDLGEKTGFIERRIHPKSANAIADAIILLSALVVVVARMN